MLLPAVLVVWLMEIARALLVPGADPTATQCGVTARQLAAGRQHGDVAALLEQPEEAIITRVLDLGDRKRRLVPIQIEQVAMPAWLYGIVGIDFTRRDRLVDPYDRLKAALGEPPGAPGS
jgi:hypothetical protein